MELWIHYCLVCGSHCVHITGFIDSPTIPTSMDVSRWLFIYPFVSVYSTSNSQDYCACRESNARSPGGVAIYIYLCAKVASDEKDFGFFRASTRGRFHLFI